MPKIGNTRRFLVKNFVLQTLCLKKALTCIEAIQIEFTAVNMKTNGRASKIGVWISKRVEIMANIIL